MKINFDTNAIGISAMIAIALIGITLVTPVVLASSGANSKSLLDKIFSEISSILSNVVSIFGTTKQSDNSANSGVTFAQSSEQTSQFENGNRGQHSDESGMSDNGQSRHDGEADDNGHDGIDDNSHNVNAVFDPNSITSIQVKILDGISKVELKIGDETVSEFTVDSVDLNDVISEIASQTGLAEDQISQLLDVQNNMQDDNQVEDHHGETEIEDEDQGDNHGANNIGISSHDTVHNSADDSPSSSASSGSVSIVEPTSTTSSGEVEIGHSNGGHSRG